MILLEHWMLSDVKFDRTLVITSRLTPSLMRWGHSMAVFQRSPWRPKKTKLFWQNFFQVAGKRKKGKIESNFLKWKVHFMSKLDKNDLASVSPGDKTSPVALEHTLFSKKVDSNVTKSATDPFFSIISHNLCHFVIAPLVPFEL